MHLTDLELRAWREGRQDGRDRIVAHLAACDRCGGRLAELLRTAPAGAAPSAFDAEEFRAAGRAAGTFRAGPRRSVWRYAPAAAAAAAVIIAAVYLGPLRRETSAVRGGETAVRLVQPSGSIAPSELRFAWEGPPGSYRLRVFDLASSDQPVIARDDAVSGYRPSAEELRRLRAGISYRWFVERPESDAVSPAGRFTLR